MLASTGIEVLNQAGETAGYTLLDLASKVGFLSLNTWHKLERAHESPQAHAYEAMQNV